MTRLRIARHEMRLAWRSGAAPVIAAVIAALLVTATAIGLRRHETAAAQRMRYQEVVASQFRDQPDRHPHRVAHYGFLVFRPPAPLGFLDTGLEDHAGSTLFLEAHRQNGTMFSDAAQSDGLRRMADLTPALVVQVIVPLLVFGIGGVSVARERDAGTLTWLLCQGASWADVLWGKVLGTIAVVATVLVPGVVVVSLWLGLVSGTRLDGDTALRFVALALATVGYLIGCAAIAVVVSARQPTSRSALVLLLALWVLLWIVVPRVAPMVAATLHPLPSRAAFEAEVERQIRALGDSHDPDDPKFVALRRDTLTRYGVSRVEDLPINYNGLVTLEGERMSSRAHATHQQTLRARFAQQMRLVDAAAAISPLIAMRGASMSAAGADLPHLLAFEDDAEAYRYDLVQRLNQLHATEVTHARDRYAGSGERDVPSRQRIDRSHWAEMPLFSPTSRPLPWAIGERPAPWLLIGAWTILPLAILVGVARRPRVLA